MMTPVEMFYYRFHRFQASFFHLEVLQQQRVELHAVLIEKTDFPDAQCYFEHESER